MSESETAGLGAHLFQICLTSHFANCSRQLSETFFIETFLVILGIGGAGGAAGAAAGAGGAGAGFESSRFIDEKIKVYLGTQVPLTVRNLSHWLKHAEAMIHMVQA